MERESTQLARPGAGLPWYELLAARLIFRRHRKKHTAADHLALFDAERLRIGDLIRSLPAEAAARQVLIKRLPGIEDSSRNWSALMVAEHLRIVNELLTRIVNLLGRGETLDEVIGTADVKPRTDVGPEVLDEFDRSCSLLVQEFEQITNLRTEAKYPHPWFGPLDAADWLAMTSFHTRLHRQQIERICQAMG